MHGVDAALAVKFKVEVATTLKEALTILPTIKPSFKLEVVVIFSYDTYGESLYLWPTMCPQLMCAF